MVNNAPVAKDAFSEANKAINGVISSGTPTHSIGCHSFPADLVNCLEAKEALLFWHCGNGPFNLSDKKPKIDRVFGGLSEISSLRSSVATVCWSWKSNR